MNTWKFSNTGDVVAKVTATNTANGNVCVAEVRIPAAKFNGFVDNKITFELGEDGYEIVIFD